MNCHLFHSGFSLPWENPPCLSFYPQCLQLIRAAHIAGALNPCVVGLARIGGSLKKKKTTHFFWKLITKNSHGSIIVCDKHANCLQLIHKIHFYRWLQKYLDGHDRNTRLCDLSPCRCQYLKQWHCWVASYFLSWDCRGSIQPANGKSSFSFLQSAHLRLVGCFLPFLRLVFSVRIVSVWLLTGNQDYIMHHLSVCPSGNQAK